MISGRFKPVGVLADIVDAGKRVPYAPFIVAFGVIAAIIGAAQGRGWLAAGMPDHL